jgi:hypothetical protein
MPQLANTVDTYDIATLRREDLRDILYTASPDDTPVYSMLGKGSANDIVHRWTTDTLRAAAANAHIDGDETAFSAYSAPTQVSNTCQIFKDSFLVSGTANAVRTTGGLSEVVRQSLKKQKEVMQDTELTIVGNQAPNAGNATTARQLRPMMGWFATNTSRGAGGANGTASLAAVDGTTRPFTEALIRTVMESIANNASEMPSVLMCHTSRRQAISAFTGNGTRFNEVENGKLKTSVSVYESDFADLTVQSNRLMRTREVAILNPSKWEWASLRDMETQPLGKSGDADKFQVLHEGTLVCQNEAFNGVVADLA